MASTVLSNSILSSSPSVCPCFFTPSKTASSCRPPCLLLSSNRGRSAAIVSAASSSPGDSPPRDAIQPQQRSRNGPLEQSRRPRDSSLLLLDSWDPFSRGGLRQMMSMMDRLFFDDWGPVRSQGRGGRQSGSSSVRAPWDVIEDEAAFHIRIDMPGFSKEDVKVSVDDGMLLVTAERDPGKEDSRWEAKSYSKFSTRLPLPEKLQLDQISAELKNGVLFVTVPKMKADDQKGVINVEVS